MSGEFLDSNVFVYLFDETAPQKQRIAEQLIGSALENGSGCISYQVIQETLNVITKKIHPPASASDARQFLDRVLLPLWRVMPTASLYHRGIDLQARYGYGIHDALIIAAAIEEGCKFLLSEDLQDGQKIDGLTIRNPFRDSTE